MIAFHAADFGGSPQSDVATVRGARHDYSDSLPLDGGRVGRGARKLVNALFSDTILH